MRIKIINTPNLSGFVWTEVFAGFSFLVGIGATVYPL